MIYRKTNEAHWEALLTIARDELGIHSFDPIGKPSADFRMCRVEDIARHLADRPVGHQRDAPGGHVAVLDHGFVRAQVERH